jgi:predicted O-methyltransferase YrrM
MIKSRKNIKPRGTRKNKTSDIKTKYAEELSRVQMYMQNHYLYNMFLDYGFHVDGKFIPLDSNINVYEGCFISLVFQTYLHKNKLSQFNVCEIGLAYGTSSMVILNEIIKGGLPSNYTVLDPNQTRQWNSIGHKNIINFKKKYDDKNLVDYKLIEGFSNIEMPRLTGEYNIVFIDGSHATDIVMEDMVNADNLLVNGGIMILDDVRHKEVQTGVEWFARNYPQYKRVFVDEKHFPSLKFHKMARVYDPYGNKKSYNNPTTMFALMKDTNYNPNEMLLQHHVSLHLHDHDIKLKEKFIETALKIFEPKDFHEIETRVKELTHIDCLQPGTTKAILCMNRIIKEIRELDSFLMYDFHDIVQQHKRNPSHTISHGLVQMNRNLSMFCVLALIYVNTLINIDIIVGEPEDDKNKKLKRIINNTIMNNIIPEIYSIVTRLLEVIIYRKGYDHRLFFNYMVPKSRSLNKSINNWKYNNSLAKVNKQKTYMKGNNPKINLLESIRKTIKAPTTRL